MNIANLRVRFISDPECQRLLSATILLNADGDTIPTRQHYTRNCVEYELKIFGFYCATKIPKFLEIDIELLCRVVIVPNYIVFLEILQDPMRN